MLERRRLARTRVQAVAQIILDDNSAVECTVRDLTALGAGITTTRELACSSRTFDLTFDRARSLRHCRVIWQKMKRIGVKFVEPTAAKSFCPNGEADLRITCVKDDKP
jgi:PilZ domain